MSPSCRGATAADGPALAATGRRVFVETFGAHFDPDDLALHLDRQFGPGGLPAELTDPKVRVMMAEEDGAPCAYLKLVPMSLPVPHERGALEIKQLYVLARWQGAGVAATLIDWAIETARAEGVRALYLSVWEHGLRARRFYARYGFEVVGTAPFRLGTRDYDDPVMRLGLG